MAALILGAAACSSSPATTPRHHEGDHHHGRHRPRHGPGRHHHGLQHAVQPLEPGPGRQDGGHPERAVDHQPLCSRRCRRQRPSASQGSKIDSINILTAAQCAKQSLPPQCAHVVYDILGTGGTAILPNNNGYAVFINGKWLVAKATICTLLGLFYTAEGKTGSPPGC